MIPGANRSPYRLPCEGTTICGNGPRNQHATAADKNVPKYIYAGQVPDWATEGNFIAPYERYNPSSGSCEGTDACPDPTSAAAPCLPWIGTGTCQYLQTADAPNPLPDPNWTESGTVNLATCHKYGYKNVQALRYWHGAPGYFFDAGNLSQYTCASSEDSAGNPCGWYPFYAYNSAPTQSKYTSAAYDLTLDYVTHSGDGNYSYEQSGTLTVNPLTGVLTASGLVNTDPGTTIADAMSGAGISLDMNPTDWLALLWSGAEEYIGLEADGVTVTCTDSSWTASEDDVTGGSGSWTIGDASLSGENYSTGLINTTITLISLTDSSLSFSVYNVNAGSGDFDYSLLTGTVTLSGSNTGGDVQADLITLLSEWDLSDDAQYPWRTDGFTSIAPLVSRNEVQGNVSPLPSGGLALDWTDPNAALCDETILGAPLPAGYEGYFDFAYIVYDGSFTIEGWGMSASAANSTWGIPLNATQWTETQTAAQFGPGAWIFYNHNPTWEGCGNYIIGPGAVCIAQKWAETKMPFASQNFFRPAGNDRFVYDETQVYSICATAQNTGGATIGPGWNISLENTADCSEVTISDSSGLWGGSAVGGFYEIASVTAATGAGCENACVVTLGALVYNLPSDWTSASDDDASCFGKLRWSTGDAATDPPAILGRAGISAIAEYESNPDVTELTTDSLPTLGMPVSGNDSVDIYDSGMTLISGNLAVTRVDDSHFTVPVAVGTLTGAAWIMSHGAPDYYWNDQYPKGDYVYTDWTWDVRSICEAIRINGVNTACAGGDACAGCPETESYYAYPFSDFTQEAGCVGFNPHCVTAFYITPNGESSPLGATYGFPAFDFDEQYGSGWQAEIQQVMVDLLYQTPHWPAQGAGCSADSYTWTQDDGTCHDSVSPDLYFPYPALVECRLTVPAGAPDLPDGITLGWDSPVAVESGAWSPDYTELPPPGDGSLIFPPQANGTGVASFNIWNLWENECGCVTNGGDFQTDYENVVIGCS